MTVFVGSYAVMIWNVPRYRSVVKRRSVVHRAYTRKMLQVNSFVNFIAQQALLNRKSWQLHYLTSAVVKVHYLMLFRKAVWNILKTRSLLTYLKYRKYKYQVLKNRRKIGENFQEHVFSENYFT